MEWILFGVLLGFIAYRHEPINPYWRAAHDERRKHRAESRRKRTRLLLRRLGLMIISLAGI